MTEQAPDTKGIPAVEQEGARRQRGEDGRGVMERRWSDLAALIIVGGIPIWFQLIWKWTH